MSLTRREFLQLLAVASAYGLDAGAGEALAASEAERFYELSKAAGNVTLMHFTDCHAQLLPIHFREPDVNIGIGDAYGKPPHLVGEALLKHFRVSPKSRLAHAYTHVDFERAAGTFGKVGGFAHLAALVKRVRAQRPGALLLDGGDTWQGSATALWTRAQDMIDASKLLGVEVMTGHWEFTYGAARVQEVVNKDLAGRIEFVAQNVKTADFGDPVFKAYVMREVNGVVIVDLSGRITLGEASGKLRDTVRDLLSKGNKKILLNLGDVTYIDSSGLGELVSSYTTAANQGAKVKLLNVQKKVDDLLQITKLYTVFDSFTDESKAVSSY